MTIRAWIRRWLKREPIMSPVWRSMGYRPGPAMLSNEAYKKVGYVYRCIRVLADCAQQIPVFAAERNPGNGKVKRLPDIHPLAQLIQTPNYEDDFAGLIESIVTNKHLHGESLVELEGPMTSVDPRRPPIRLWPHPGSWIAKVDVEGGRYAQFHLRARGYEKIIPGDMGAFFKTLHPDDPWRGLAPLAAAFQAADTFYACNVFNAKLFENGAIPSLAVMFDKDSGVKQLDPAQRERIRTEVERLHGGLMNAHGVAVLGPGESLKELGTNLKDMFFQSLMKFARGEILSVFGVPLLMVGEPETSNRATATEQVRMFWMDTEIPMVEDIASLFNRKISRRYGDNCVVVWDYQRVPALARDMKAMSDAMVPLIVNGVLTINEARTDQLDKPPVPWGDVWWRPQTLVSSASEQIVPQPVPPASDSGEPSSGGKIAPTMAQKLLGEWKNAAIMRVKFGARTPMEAFPPGHEATKAANRYGVPFRAAWELANLAFTEMALNWDTLAPEDFVADYFDRHIESLEPGRRRDAEITALSI